jgi:hypothetical protein
MNRLPEKKFPLSTSAYGSMVDKYHEYPVVSIVLLDSLSKGTSTTKFNLNLLITPEITCTGSTIPSTSSTERTRIALNQLRKLSGLTWEQMAKLFDVKRRIAYLWASGKPLSRFNEEQLNRLLVTIQYINRGSASANRTLLLTPDVDGRLPLDLLMDGKYEEVKRIIGSGNISQKPQLTPLSEDARASRRPPNPVDLMEALQEPIHWEVGRSRPAKAIRSHRNGTGE